VEALLAWGANASAADAAGETPLAVAVRTDQSSVVVSLLHAGASVEVRDARGRTALHEGAKAGAEASVQVLLEHGAPLDIVDNYGHTPLDYARREGHDSVARAILMAPTARVAQTSPEAVAPQRAPSPAYGGPPVVLQARSSEGGSGLGILASTLGVILGAVTAMAIAYAIRQCQHRSKASAVAALPHMPQSPMPDSIAAWMPSQQAEASAKGRRAPADFSGSPAPESPSGRSSGRRAISDPPSPPIVVQVPAHRSPAKHDAPGALIGRRGGSVAGRASSSPAHAPTMVSDGNEVGLRASGRAPGVAPPQCVASALAPTPRQAGSKVSQQSKPREPAQQSPESGSAPRTPQRRRPGRS